MTMGNESSSTNILRHPRPPQYDLRRIDPRHERRLPLPALYINKQFWVNKGVQWTDETNGVIVDPHKTFGPMPANLKDDTEASLDFELHVFSTLCGIIRSRAWQLNQQSYPAMRDFFRRYTLQIKTNPEWSMETIQNLFHLIERLKFNCFSRGSNPSYHSNTTGSDVEWRNSTQWGSHAPSHITCTIHHLPPDLIDELRQCYEMSTSRENARVEDKQIVDFMGHFYKFEFHQFHNEQLRRHAHPLALENVVFMCDAPEADQYNLRQIQAKWKTMQGAVFKSKSASLAHDREPFTRSFKNQ